MWFSWQIFERTTFLRSKNSDLHSLDPLFHWVDNNPHSRLPLVRRKLLYSCLPLVSYSKTTSELLQYGTDSWEDTLLISSVRRSTIFDPTYLNNMQHCPLPICLYNIPYSKSLAWVELRLCIGCIYLRLATVSNITFCNYWHQMRFNVLRACVCVFVRSAFSPVAGFRMRSSGGLSLFTRRDVIIEESLCSF